MKKNKIINVVVSSVLAIGVLSSCSAQRTPAPAATEAPSAAAQNAAPTSTNPRTAKNPYVDNIKIAYVAHDLGTAPNQAWLKGMRDESKYYPNIKVQDFDGKSSADTEIQIMNQAITQKYDAIILQASDNAALSPVVTQAEQAGIPVITLNLGVDSPHAAQVQMVDYDAGRLVATEMAKELNNTGNVVIIQGLPGIPRAANLEKGFRETIAKFPNIKIVGSQPASFQKEKAMTVMNSFMQSNAKIDGVYAINDDMAEGASLAAQSANRLKDMKIWGTDGQKSTLDLIAKGLVTGTIYTNCHDEGATCERLACMLINSGYNSSALKTTPVMNLVPVVATKDSVGTIAEKDRW